MFFIASFQSVLFTITPKGYNAPKIVLFPYEKGSTLEGKKFTFCPFRADSFSERENPFDSVASPVNKSG